MLKILKASAGSGKTYNLAREYIRLIVRSNQPDAYRHVLAVTFTNKATDEMKRRILKELHTLAMEPDESKYLDYLTKETGLDKTSIQKRARTQLSGILHDYSAFAVSTIDRFFQQTLRAFSREIGQFSTYQVQLDDDMCTYTDHGTTTLMVDPSATLVDAWNIEKGAVTTQYEGIASAIQSSENDAFNQHNTTLTIENGRVVKINRRYVP